MATATEATKTNSFFARYAANTRGLAGVNSGFAWTCPECLDAYGYRDLEDDDGNVTRTAAEIAEADWRAGKVIQESHFSWSSCDTCGSHLGGDREYGHGFDSKNEIVHLSMCVDCVLFTANGDLPAEDGRRHLLR